MKLERTVTVWKPVDEVIAYLADFTTTTEWDPVRTVRTVRTAGGGDIGTEYQNSSKFGGRVTELTYVVEDLVRNQRIALRASNKTVVARDTMTFREKGNETEVTYTADFAFKGFAKFIPPLMKPAFTRLGDKAEMGLAQALARL